MSVSAILAVRKKRLALQREADLLEQEEKGLTNDLIAHMLTNKLDAATEGDDSAYLTTTEEPNVTEWPKLLDYIKENDALDFLQKRVTASAIKARWKDGVTIPGVIAVEKHSLKFNV